MTKKTNKRNDPIKIISKAYDKTVDDYNGGVDEEDLLPEEFKNSERYKRFKNRHWYRIGCLIWIVFVNIFNPIINFWQFTISELQG